MNAAGLVERAEEARASVEAELREARRLLREAEAMLDEEYVAELRAEALLAEGSSSAEVEATVERYAAQRAEAEAAVVRLEPMLAALDGEIARAERARRVEEHRALARELEAAHKPLVAAAGKLGVALQEAAAQAASVVELRRGVDGLRGQVYAAEQHARTGDALAGLVDEPEWRPEAWQTLADLLRTGPRRPVAAAARAELDRGERAAQARQGEEDRRVREVATASFSTKRLYAGEPVADVVDRLMADGSCPPEWRERVLEERQRQIAAYERQVAQQHADAASSWTERGLTPPPMELEPHEQQWRVENEIDAPETTEDPADEVEEPAEVVEVGAA